MNRLLKNKTVTLTAILLVLIIGGLVIAWQSALYTLNHMSLKQVSTSQLAAAMQKDEFWLDNRFNTLIFEGRVKSLSVNGSKTTLQFVTTDSYSASCELDNSTTSTKYKVGGTYKFAAETYQAERQPDGVLLHNCMPL